MEDDPYYYLQFSPGGGQPKGLHDLGRSYLSMDVDGRVVRMDSFSKVSPSAHPTPANEVAGCPRSLSLSFCISGCSTCVPERLLCSGLKDCMGEADVAVVLTGAGARHEAGLGDGCACAHREDHLPPAGCPHRRQQLHPGLLNTSAAICCVKIPWTLSALCQVAFDLI